MYFDKISKATNIYELLLIINFIACDRKIYTYYNFIVIVRHFDVEILRQNFQIYNYNTCNNNVKNS